MTLVTDVPAAFTTEAPIGPNASATSPGRLHLHHIEGMRALAALVVVMNHIYAQVWQGGQQTPAGPLAVFSYFMALGHFAVAVFIVISGYCLMLPVVRGNGSLRGGTTAFYRSRARRILPPYFGALALSLALIWLVIGQPTGTLWDVCIVIRRQDLISHLLLTQDVFGTGRINYVFWSIATEWQIYLLFPLMLWAWARYGPYFTVTGAITSAYALSWALDGTRGARACAYFFGLFALGMLAAAVTHGKDARLEPLRRRLPWTGLALTCAVLVAAVTVHWGWRETTQHYFVMDALVASVAFCLLIIGARPGSNLLRKAFSWRPLSAVGGFSYSVYLIHAPLLQIMWQYGLNPARLQQATQFVLFLCPGIPLILGTSYLFHLAIERPFMSAVKSVRPAEPPLLHRGQGHQLQIHT